MRSVETTAQPHSSDSFASHPSTSHVMSPTSPSGETRHGPSIPLPLSALLTTEEEPQLAMRPLPANEDDVAACLQIYREELAPHFPFVIIPDIPASDLYAKSPFLCKTVVMAASYKQRSFQHHLGSQLTEELGRRLLVEGEKSFDVLQGLLVHIAWYHVHFNQISQMTNLLQLAIAMLADLGLNRPTHANDRRKFMFDSSRINYGFLVEARTLKNEERRALLGCFYVSSVCVVLFWPMIDPMLTLFRVSAIFRRVNALEYTSYLEKELHTLLDSHEYESDLLLAGLVQVQQIAERIVQAVPYDEPDNPHVLHAPIILHLKTLQRELESQAQSIPPVLKHNGSFRCNCERSICKRSANHVLAVVFILNKHNAEVLLHESGLYHSFWQTPSSTTERINVLWRCLRSVKAFWDTFLSIPDHMVFTLPYSGWGPSTYIILIFSRLFTLECPGWDPQVAREALDFPTVVDAILAKMESATRYAKSRWLIENYDELCERVTERVKFIKLSVLQSQRSAKPDSDNPDEQLYNNFAPPTVLADDFWEGLMKDCEPLQF
ncbi:hypothetical protein NUU61_006647 [Penicillium alfredii]|uniref:Transcription factor domain-containing protein n=1 Tax=Penicillium alfredii TaxID=1506179 RepID=A0A9W9F1C2_9EURO|nr:uncharacterized protein NUU61_006647 [Penicillium alfredii]KAJ5091777.1 hypothetical protein NUU61_006647 [Penicillium alfredii]